MKTPITAIFTVGAVLAIGTASVAGLRLAEGSAPSTAASTRQAQDEAFWNRLRVSGDEVEQYATLSSMAAAADAVIVGRATNFRESRRIQGDAAEDTVVYGALDVNIERVVRGILTGSTVTVEVLLPHRPDRVAAIVSKQRTSLPQGQMLMFLRRKKGGESAHVRLIESRGLWVSEQGALRAPLAREPVPENVVALSPAAVLQEQESDRSVRAAAATAGLLPRVQMHPGLVRAVRGGSSPPQDDDEDVNQTPEEAFSAELQGKQSIEELVRALAP